MQVGVDIGGTFTDLLVATNDRKLHVVKTPSTPINPENAIVNGLAEVEESLNRSPETIGFFSHGTTVATNAVLETDWADTALVTTKGFRDVLEIGRQDRPDLYDLQAEKADLIVPRDRRYEVPERIATGGEIITPFDEESAREVARAIDATDVSAVAVTFLNAFENPGHEEQMREVLQEVCNDITVTLSSQVLPEIREYERTTTTAMSAALAPVMGTYLDNLRTALRDLGVTATLNVMQSNGGIITGETARKKAINTLLSGPAAGVRGATHVSQAVDIDNIITMDMGGTSCDVSIVPDGKPVRSAELKVGNYPVRIPMIDIHTIGNGGGSKAWLDAGGALRVGPQSAGAQPGPICYGRGGKDITITDAHALLNRLDPTAFIGDNLGIDSSTLYNEFESQFADELGRTPEQVAQDILDVANANMLRALKVISTERGHNPREFTLVAFGGAGPLHATKLAHELNVGRVLVPHHAGVLSALGLLVSDTVYDYVQSYLRPWEAVDPDDVEEMFQKLEREGDKQLAAADVPKSARSFERAVDVRYQGQSFELTVSAPNNISMASLKDVAEQFHNLHRKRYGHAKTDEPLELVNIRVDATGYVEPPSLDDIPVSNITIEEAEQTTRDVYFDGEVYECTVYDRNRLAVDSSFDGPAIIEGEESTISILPTQCGHVDEYGNVLVEPKEGDR